MTSITLWLFGPPEQKVIARVTPMSTLRDAVASVAAKFRPPLNAAAVVLQHKSKGVELDVPFRLLNLPAGAKLEITRIQKDPALAQQSQPVAVTPAPPCAPVQPQQITAEPQLQLQSPPPQQQQQQEETTQREEASHATQQEQQTINTTEQQPSIPPTLTALGITVPLHVFHQRSLEAAGANSSPVNDDEPPDEFYDLNMEDLARLQQQAAAKKQAEAGFRPRALREAEGAARAAALGPVRVRLHYPDGSLVQAQFAATDCLGTVLGLARACVLPQRAGQLYLYTAPPKAVLRDTDATLYALQLVPAAHIYVGFHDGAMAGGQLDCGVAALHPDVAALMQDAPPPPPPPAAAAQGSDAADEKTVAARAARLAAAAMRAQAHGDAGGRSTDSSGNAGGPSKVPKWLKMGSK